MIQPLSAPDGPTAYIHGRGPIWEKGKAGRMDFLNLVRSVLETRGFAVTWVPYSEGIEAWARADPRHLHIVLDDTPLTGRNIVFCVPSYLHGFWYFDPAGTRNNSSMAQRQFQPETMSERFATAFTDTLRAKFVAPNRSKFAQTLQPGFTPEPGAICIFTQTFAAPRHYRHFMTYPELIEGVIAHRKDRRVYIKPHPRQTLEETMTLMRYHDPHAGVEVTPHAIHGLLAKAGAAISLSSAVLLEAQMHGVAGVVAGQVDFHHNMIVVQEPAKIADALDRAFSTDFPFDKYLVFFFAQGMVQPQLRQKAAAHVNLVLEGMAP